MRLNQITVGVHDVGVAIAFYRTLGLRLIVQNLPEYARFEMPDGDSTFSVHFVDGPCGQDFPLIYFEVHDIDHEVTRLKAAGISLEADPVDQRWAWREAYLRDPSGNRICLYHAGLNRRYPPWRIDLKG